MRWRSVPLAAVGIALFCGVVGVVGGSPTVATSGPLAVLVAGIERRQRRTVAYQQEADRLLVYYVDQVVAALRSGASLRQACQSVGLGGVPRSVEPLVAGLGSGRTLGSCCGELAAVPDRSVRLLAVTVGVLSLHGGPAVPALQRLRHTLMGRVNGRRLADTESSQALASAGLLVVAPGVFACAVAAVDPAMARFYLVDPLGATLVFLALGLASVGWYWIRAITRSVVGEMR